MQILSTVVQLNSDELHQLPSTPAGVLLDVAIPSTQIEQANACARMLAERSNCPVRIIVIPDEAKLGFIKICNELFKASTAPYFAYVAQDAFPGRRWASIAIRSLEKSNQGLLAFNDGKWYGKLASFGLARRSWANQNYKGDLFCNEYKSHYADTELSMIAMDQGQLCYNPNAVLIEVDFEKDRKGNNPFDKALYAKRKLNGFDGKVKNEAVLELFK